MIVPERLMFPEVIAEPLTFPAVEIVANFVSAIAADVEMSAFTIVPAVNVGLAFNMAGVRIVPLLTEIPETRDAMRRF